MNRSFNQPSLLIGAIVGTIGIVAAGKYFLELSKCRDSTVITTLPKVFLPYRRKDGSQLSADAARQVCRFNPKDEVCAMLPKDPKFDLPNRQNSEMAFKRVVPATPVCWEQKRIFPGSE